MRTSLGWPIRTASEPVAGATLPAENPGANRRCERGFALLIVLWTLVLIAFIVAHIAVSGHSEIRIAENLADNAVTAAAADGAISEAIFNLSNPQPQERWPLDGSVRELPVGDCRVALRLEDEASRINPNLASPVLLQALLQTLGVNPQMAAHLAGAIAEWVGTAETQQPAAAILADYRAAGLNYGPPQAPLESLGELGEVLGMTPSVLALLRPHLTLYGPAEPNPNSSDPAVAAALAMVAETGDVAPSVDPTPPGIVTARIIADGSGPGDARVERVAVVRVGSALPGGYSVLAWGNEVD
jgi:general secretion pathway protein K